MSDPNPTPVPTTVPTPPEPTPVPSRPPCPDFSGLPLSTGNPPGTHGITPDGHRYVVYDGEVKVDGTRAWRNNNPGNHELGTAAWSAYGTDSSKTTFPIDHGAIGSDGRFAIYGSDETGQTAAITRMKQQPDQTIRDLINVLTPAIENDTNTYVDHVQDWSGIDSDSTIGSLSDEQLVTLLAAIKRAEGWPPTRNPDIQEPQTYSNTPGAPEWVRALLGGVADSYDPNDPSCSKIGGPARCTCGRIHPFHLGPHFGDPATACTCWCGKKHLWGGH